MALPLDFELRLEERCEDRVVVSVLLAPRGPGAVHIQGVTLHLERRDGERIGAERVLPIAGDLAQPMLSTIELMAEDGELPLGARIVGVAWDGAEQNEAQLPADPYTELEAHLRARRRITPTPSDGETAELGRVSPKERARLSRLHPWINDPRLPPPKTLAVLEHDETSASDDVVDDLVDDLGLDADSTEWLKDLLRESGGEE